MLHHRAAPARADGHPGLPRRPARHRDHLGRRPDQRAGDHRPRHEDDEARLQRRRRRRHRLHRTDQGDGLRARQRHPLRHQGRRLPGPHRGHEPVEVGACRQDRRAQPRRGARRRRRLPRPLGQGRADAGDGPVDGEEPDHLRHGQSRSGDHARGGRRNTLGRHHGDRPLGLPEPGQQRSRLPLHLPRRARRAGDHHQRRT